MSNSTVRILVGDVRQRLAEIADESIDCCVTSPPYWGLRDYGCEGQIGLEPTPQAYVAAIVAVFRDVRRVLKDDGTLWLNLGDCYAGSWGAQGRDGEMAARAVVSARQVAAARRDGTQTGSLNRTPGLKPKDLVGTPWRVAFALQEDGWYLRSDIVWHKPNPMPESVTDRPTKAHEYVFLLSKSERYYYDAAAIVEKCSPNTHDRGVGSSPKNEREAAETGRHVGFGAATAGRVEFRNARTVWTIPSQPFRGAHFATFPPDLAKRCLLAGCRQGGTVLDPFFGAGTVGLVAAMSGQHAVGVELNPEYAEIARQRIADATGLLSRVTVESQTREPVR
jgi:DNA modification methylase